MPSLPTIEPLSWTDLSEIVTLASTAPGAPQWSPAAWEAFVPGSPAAAPLDRRALVARTAAGANEHRLDGVIAFTLLPPTTELELVLVHPRARRHGLGRRLSERWLAEAAAAGAREALLEVRPSNIAAQRLYRQLGFVLQGHRRAYYRDPVEDALLMRLALAPSAAQALAPLPNEV